MICKCYREEKNYLGRPGVCNGTWEREPCLCGGNPLRCDFYPEKRKVVSKSACVGDWIRSLPNDELADLFVKWVDCRDDCPARNENSWCIMDESACKNAWVAFLDGGMKIGNEPGDLWRVK